MNFQDILKNDKLSARERCDMLFGLKLNATRKGDKALAKQIGQALDLVEKLAKKEIVDIIDGDDTDED